jgi:hypothetical protein
MHTSIKAWKAGRIEQARNASTHNRTKKTPDKHAGLDATAQLQVAAWSTDTHDKHLQAINIVVKRRRRAWWHTLVQYAQRKDGCQVKKPYDI